MQVSNVRDLRLRLNFGLFYNTMTNFYNMHYL